MEGAQIPGDSVKGNKGRPLHVEGGGAAYGVGNIWSITGQGLDITVDHPV